MAEEAKNDEIERQTGVGAYLWKQLYQQTVAWGGLLGGAYSGLLAGKALFKDKITNPVLATAKQTRWEELPFLSKLPGLKNVPTQKHAISAGVGAMVGMLVSGVMLGYEHWKKIKQSQLQVDEITKDVSDIEVFKKTDPELKAENERLWAELKKRDGATTMVEKVGGPKKETWKDKAAEQADMAAEASR